MLKGELSPGGVFNSSEALSPGIEQMISASSRYLTQLGWDRSFAFLLREWLILPGSQLLDDLSKKALYALLLFEFVERQKGSAFVPIDRDFMVSLANNFVARADLQKVIDKVFEFIDEGLPDYVGAPEEHQPLVVEGNSLYAWKIRELEFKLSEELKQRFDALSESVSIAAAIKSDIDLSEEQSEAVTKAVGSKFTVIMGGPGTGKSTIITAIKKTLIAQGEEEKNIALSAPTGKAAKRLKGGITLHRLLGYQAHSGNFEWHENKKLRYSTVIVDEVSMIDNFMIYRLFLALPKNTRLILVGDPDQLPSIDTGCFLKDMNTLSTQRHEQHFVCLTENFRMSNNTGGQEILELTRAIARNENDEGVSQLKTVSTYLDLSWQGAEFLENKEPEELAGFLQQWYHNNLCEIPAYEGLVRKIYNFDDHGFLEEDKESLRHLFSILSSHKILCLPRVGARGSVRLNHFVQDLHRDHFAFEQGDYIPGDPVIYLRNDYQKSLFNGDVGVVIQMRGIDDEISLKVVFLNNEDELVFWPLSLCRLEIELAYAMTVHKSQGSEFKRVAFILPEKEIPLISKEILYTGITRSKESLLVCGEKELLLTGLSRTMMRRSGLVDRI